MTVNCFHPLILHISGQNSHFWSFDPHILPFILFPSPSYNYFSFFFPHTPSFHGAGCRALLGMPRKEYKTRKNIYNAPLKYFLSLQLLTARWLLEPDVVSGGSPDAVKYTGCATRSNYSSNSTPSVPAHPLTSVSQHHNCTIDVFKHSCLIFNCLFFFFAFVPITTV